MKFPKLRWSLIFAALFCFAFYVALGIIVLAKWVPRSNATPVPPEPTPTLSALNFAERQ